ncbi:MAG: flippase-like domain-containing protein [Acidisphaera sp.]|nr:flippase-like domain-containing protein [Acidisphaera sp.]
MKTLSVVLALAGLALGTLLVGWIGFARVAQATLSVGWGGFALLAVWQAVLFGVLGFAWHAVLPSGTAPVRLAAWARMVRDAAGTCLPFSQMGAFLFGARALSLHGVSWTRAAASTVVDVTAEFLGQIGFAALGLAVLLGRVPDSALTRPLAAGLGLALAAAAGFVGAQLGAGRAFRLLARRIAAGWVHGAVLHVDALQSELAGLYRRGPRLALAVGLHGLAWIGTGAGTWIAYRLLGADIDLSVGLAVEGLTDALLGVAFLVPGYAGVQEAGYATIGAIFGLPPELSLGVSLLRRARDLALGVPILLSWQLLEARRVGATGRA